jgi:parallel beta-helix repeat protein
MKKIIFVIFLSILFFNFISFSIASNKTLIKNIIYVDDDNSDGPWDGSIEYPFRYIQDGIDIATEGDTVYVYNGTYNESYIYIKRSINLVGENRDKTIIDAKQAVDVIYVYAPYVNISGLYIRNAFRAGINLASNSSNYVNIYNNIFSDNAHGIHPYFSNKNLTISNNIFLNNVNGIYLVSSSYACIFQNNIINNSWGIRISSSTHNKIYNNNITFFKKMGIELDSFSNSNYIYNNNFIRNSGSINAYFRLFSVNNIWDENYWDGSGTRPYIIWGSILTIIPTWINIDWHPVGKPNNIQKSSFL